MADTDVVITAKDLTKAAFDSATRNAAQFGNALSSLFAPLAAVTSAAGFGALIKSQVDLGDQLSKTSQKLGISVEDLSAYQYAAKLSGVSNDELSGTLTKLANNINDAIVNKGGEAATYFRALGIQVTDNAGRARDLGGVFDDLAAKLSTVKDGVQKTALENKLLGKSGSEITPLINNLKELKQEAFDTGNVMSTDFAKNAEKFNDTLNRLTEGSGKLARMIAGPLILALDDMIQRINVAAGLQKELSLDILERDKAALVARYQAIASGADFVASLAGETKDSILTQIDALDKLIIEENKRQLNHQKIKSGGADINIPGGIAEQKQDEAFLKFNESLKNRVIALDESLLTERERWQLHYEKNVMLAEDAYARGITSAETYQRQIEDLEIQHQAKMGNIQAQAALAQRNFDQMTFQGKRDFVLSEMLRLTQGVAGHNKVLFEINKTAAIAQTVISAIEGSQKAFTQYAAYPPLAYAMAALTLAAGYAKVDMIRRTTFGSGSPSGGGGSGGAPSIPTQQNIPSIDQNQTGGQRTVQIHISGNVMTDQFVLENVIPVIRDATDNADVIIFNSDSRQAQEMRP